MRLPHDTRRAQIHRFRDRVALYVRNDEGDGVTVYLTPADARRIARALNAGAREVKALPFAQSQFRTIEFDGES